MSLLSRLIFAFMTIVSLLIAVGMTSYFIQRQVGREVADLRPSRGVDLRGVDLESSHLEIEGIWNGETFVAVDVAVGPGRRRPKLRGEIESLDPSRQWIWLYGVRIRVLPETELPDEIDSRAWFATASVGQRIEVSALATSEGWIARKIRTREVKPSDQIKGTPSAASVAEDGPQRVEFDGISVSVVPVSDPTPNGAVRQVELATELGSKLREARAAAHAVVGASPLWRGDAEDTDDREAGEAGEWLEESVQAIAYVIAQSAGIDERSGHLLTLEQKLPALRAKVGELRQLAGQDGQQSRVFLRDVFEPFLQNEMLALVYAHQREAEEDLAGRVRGISERARTMTRLVLGASALAVVLAIGLGVLTWRSIRGPLQGLQDAATRIGRGDLETRVDTRGPQELEVLARTFNQMAADLAATTLSVRNLEGVLDSMASVLVLLDREGRITEVNRAVEGMLGYDPKALIGQPFSRICPGSENDGKPTVGASNGWERTFVRADGSEVCVSFSRSELGSKDAGSRGYVCVAQDLSDWKRIEERLRATVEEKELLLREVHHRVKNNMQVVSSLLAIHAGYLRDAEAVQRFQDCQHQIQSMALIHEQLHTASQPSQIDLPGYLQTLASHLVQSFGPEAGVHLEVEADAVSMQLDQAMVCGLIVNELVTNALRHAFASGQGGRIRVLLRGASDGRCVLSVVDDGRGWSREASASEGLGLGLVETLAAQLHGEFRVGASDGVEVNVVFRPEAVAA